MPIISDFIPSGVSAASADPFASPSIGSLWTEVTATGQFVEDWYWNGTYWLSKQKYNASAETEASASLDLPLAVPITTNLFLNTLTVDYRTNGGNNDATRYWTVQLQRINTGNIATTYGTVSTQSQPANVYNKSQIVINAHLDIATTTTKALIINLVRVSNPSPLRANCLLTYQKARI